VAEPQRGILVRWSKTDENHLALLQLASGLVALKKPTPHASRSPNQDRSYMVTKVAP
jgi:hypothetical protein